LHQKVYVFVAGFVQNVSKFMNGLWWCFAET